MVARQIHREDDNVRLELQCRILADQSDAEIEEIMGLPMPVVKIYEKTFFNVRPRLHAKDWIVMCATGNKFVTEEDEPNIAAIARQFAFFGGPCILKMVLPRLFDGSALSDSPLDLNTPTGRTTMRVRLAVEGMTMPTDSKTSLELLKLWPNLMPYLSPLPEALVWNSVLVDKVADLPGRVLRTIAAKTNCHSEKTKEAIHSAEVAEVQPLETADAIPIMQLALGAA